MLLRALYISLGPGNSPKLLPVVALQIRCFTRDEKISLVKPTHAIVTEVYNMQRSEKRFEFLTDYKPLWDIRSKCGAVIRHKDMANRVGGEENDSATDEKEEEAHDDHLLIVGNPDQVKLAFDLLNRELNLREKVNPNLPQFRQTANPYTPWFKFQGKKLWEGYRRNYKGQYPPLTPRRDCRVPLRKTTGHKGSCGNPCSLCQMAYLYDYHVHFTDIEIMDHFLCPHTGNLYPTTRTNICKKQHDLLEESVQKARLSGYLPLGLHAPIKPKKVMFKHAGLPTDRHVPVQRARSWKWGAYRSNKPGSYVTKKSAFSKWLR